MGTVFKDFPHEKHAFINPEDAVRRNPAFPERCVSTFSEAIINKFASMDNVSVIGQLYTANGNIPVYQMTYKHTPIAFYLSRVGAPACAVGIEEVIALGAKKLVLFGNCGILDEERVGGRIIVPTSAVRDEGTSYHYMEASDEIAADKAAVDTLANCLEACGYPYVKGKVWTTDAIYRETQSSIQKRKAQGCLAVEMEYAAALAVTQFRSLPFIQFLYGADSLDAPTWEPRDLTDYGLSRAERYFALALECVLAL